MKLIHVITLFLVVLGGLHFVLTGFGINILTAIFGGTNLKVLYIVTGLSTIHYVLPMFTKHLDSVK